MHIILFILLTLVLLVAIGTFIHNKMNRHNKNQAADEENTLDIPLDCCGAHEVCEVEAMIQNPNEILYFEDEELDRFQNIEPNQYAEEDIEEFRDVLYTLKNDDEIRMWLISIERRGVKLPSIIKQEALQLLV
ncbi:MAG: hypothetical protein ACK5IJ_02120 [Mangrovibacterium sp.]